MFEYVVSELVGQLWLMLALMVLFGVLVGLLAMVGVYGVMAYNVRCQWREFGIRIAFGVDQSWMRNLVVGRGLMLVAVGVSIGVVAAWLLIGLLKTLLNDVNPIDPMVFGVIAAVVLLVVVVAFYFPVRSAGRVDPMVVLCDV